MADFKYESKDLEVMTSARKYHTWILSKFRKFLGKRVAEVGAGSGNFSRLLLGEPIEQLVVVEPSKNVYDLLRVKTSADTRVISLNSFFPGISSDYINYFDSIIYIDVLEHIKDDEKELLCVKKSLHKGGCVCIFVPALPWLYSDHDRSIGHFRRYRKKQLGNLLKETGFEVVSLHYFDIIGIITWLVMFKFLKKKPNQGNIGFYDKYIIPFSRFVESLIPLPIGKNLVVVGKKISD
jgi:SAM-dependent methyltransferase